MGAAGVRRATTVALDRTATPLSLAARSLALVLAGGTLGWLVNLARETPLPLGWYTPAATCEGPIAREPTVAPPAQVAAQCGSGQEALFIDTRSPEAFARGHVAGATHLPCSATALAAEELLALAGPGRVLVVYGEATQDGLDVARTLSQKAPELQTYVVEGGFDAWQEAALACASGPCDQCGAETAHAH